MNLKRITLDDTVEETVNKINENSTDIEENVSRLDADFISYKDNITLKTSKIEKELNDYKATMQQINIHQSPTQKASGYGIVSLPKNAANGQVSGIKIEGLTATNLINGRGDNLEGWTNITGDLTIEDNFFKYIGGANNKRDSYPIQVRQGDKLYLSYFYKTTGTPNCNHSFRLFLGETQIQVIGFLLAKENVNKELTRFSLVSECEGDADNIAFRPFERTSETGHWYFKHIMLINLTQAFGAGNEPTKEECDQIFANYFDGTKSTICAMRLKSVSEDESEVSTAYVVAKDEQGKIAELRSLPNGVKDEIRVSEGKAIIKIGTKTDVASGTVINYTDMTEGGTYYAWNEDGETETGIKGDTLGIDATTLIYQLATPVEIPVQVSGTLVGYPSGTVYIEPYVADAGIYTDKMEVLYSDLPIKALEKISKVDFDTGLETELDITAAVIAEDKLSFTHPDLVDGDIVFFTYEYDRESTEGETEIEYYDSRYVIKDSVTDKFYKWHVIVANGVPSIELVEV